MIHSVCHLQSDLNKRIIFPLFLNIYISEVIRIYVKQKGIFLDFVVLTSLWLMLKSSLSPISLANSQLFKHRMNPSLGRAHTAKYWWVSVVSWWTIVSGAVSLRNFMNTEIYLIKKKGEVGAEEKYMKRSVTQLASICTDTRTYIQWPFLYCKHESNKFRKKCYRWRVNTRFL